MANSYSKLDPKPNPNLQKIHITHRPVEKKPKCQILQQMQGMRNHIYMNDIGILIARAGLERQL
jgi:hypothetical protein